MSSMWPAVYLIYPFVKNTPTLSRNTTTKQKQSQQGGKRIQSGICFYGFVFWGVL